MVQRTREVMQRRAFVRAKVDSASKMAVTELASKLLREPPGLAAAKLTSSTS